MRLAVQITSNSTHMLAELALAADVDARDHCIVVIKGTFTANERGELQLADEQQPLVRSDEHHGRPDTSAVRLECEFVLTKPHTDILVVGKAVAPGRVPVERLRVRLELPGHVKEAVVVGERCWVRSLGQLFPSPPVPFVEMPLTFDRAFGGSDDSAGPNDVACEPNNLVGVGFHPRRPAHLVEGLPVANVEHPDHPIRSPRDRSVPIGFGVVGRAWLPRRQHAGTYDAAWLEQRAPYLPADFDPRYFQCAPLDQQLPPLRGGELLRCIHMAELPVVSYVLPDPSLPVRFRFIDVDRPQTARLDTVILEPHLARCQLIWRASVPLGRRPSDLREVHVGDPRATAPLIEARGGKPKFRGLDDALRTLRSGREGS